MSDELRTDFTKAERDTVINCLRDEYGDHEFSEELVLLDCQDLWRKGCHNFSSMDDCRGCECSHMNGGHCPLEDWEKRHPEYKDDALAKRLKELKDELRQVQKKELDARRAEERKTLGVRLPHSFATIAQIEKAKQVLIDNGIEADEAETVLQAVGYALLDVDLF